MNRRTHDVLFMIMVLIAGGDVDDDGGSTAHSSDSSDGPGVRSELCVDEALRWNPRGGRIRFVGAGKSVLRPRVNINGLNSSGTSGCMTGLFLKRSTFFLKLC